MISKLTLSEKNKYNNRYKIIYSSAYRKLNAFFRNMPYSYSKNFCRNVNNLEIVYNKEICEMYNFYGMYKPYDNLILYKDSHDRILIHELVHMASANIKLKSNSHSGITTYIGEKIKNNSLDEGLTQNITNNIIKTIDFSIYPFPTFIASLLQMSYGIKIYKYYYQGNYNKFINQFEDRLTIRKLINNMEKMEKYENRSNHKKDVQKMNHYMARSLENAIDLVYYNEIKKDNYNLDTLIYKVYYLVESQALNMFYDTKYIYTIILERLNKNEKLNKKENNSISKRRIICKK